MVIRRFRRAAPSFCLVALGLVLAGCATTPSEKPAPRQPIVEPAPAVPEKPARADIRVGILLPLSGPYADVGQNLVNAITMALFDSGDGRITLLPTDTKGTIAGAAEAAADVLAKDVDIILGPLLAGEVRAAAAPAQASGVPLIAFSSDSSAATADVFLMSFPPEGEVRAIVAYARERGLRKFAALVPDTPYGYKVREAFLQAVVQSGGEVTDLVSYPADSARLMEPARRVTRYDERRGALLDERAFLTSLGEDDVAAELLAGLAGRETLGEVPYDALFIAEGGAMLRALAPLIPYYEVNPKQVRFIGTGLWNDPRLLREPQLLGGWFATPEQDRAQKFMERYRAAYRREPPRITTLGYDAMALVAALARDDSADRFSPARIADANGFAGIDGIFRFRADGTVERALAVMTLTNRGFRTLKAAGDSFIANPPLASANQFGQETVQEQPAVAQGLEPATLQPQ